MTALTGNRCGHDPKKPQLQPAHPIRKGKGGLPRLLSLAAERAKAWYFHPKKCKLLQSKPDRQTRSERREACQIVIETILSHLDLASLCLGTPTLESGFIDIDMRTIVRDSGIGQRRCERARLGQPGLGDSDPEGRVSNSHQPLWRAGSRRATAVRAEKPFRLYSCEADVYNVPVSAKETEQRSFVCYDPFE